MKVKQNGERQNKKLVQILIYFIHVKTFDWDRTYQTTTLDFRFGLILPNKRKVRIITQRDDCGRIIHSTPPPLTFESPTIAQIQA